LSGRTQVTQACITEEHVDEFPVMVKVKLLNSNHMKEIHVRP
jgi:hypothetical protein